VVVCGVFCRAAYSGRSVHFKSNRFSLLSQLSQLSKFLPLPLLSPSQSLWETPISNVQCFRYQQDTSCSIRVVTVCPELARVVQLEYDARRGEDYVQ
jgi:hypothetical protein